MLPQPPAGPVARPVGNSGLVIEHSLDVIAKTVVKGRQSYTDSSERRSWPNFYSDEIKGEEDY